MKMSMKELGDVEKVAMLEFALEDTRDQLMSLAGDGSIDVQRWYCDALAHTYALMVKNNVSAVALQSLETSHKLASGILEDMIFAQHVVVIQRTVA